MKIQIYASTYAKYVTVFVLLVGIAAFGVISVRVAAISRSQDTGGLYVPDGGLAPVNSAEVRTDKDAADSLAKEARVTKIDEGFVRPDAISGGTEPTESNPYPTAILAAFEPPISLAVAAAIQVQSSDFNGDTFADLAVLRSDSISILISDGSGGYNAPVTTSLGTTPVRFAIGDFSGDGKMDVAVAFGTTTTQTFPGNADGTFGTPTSSTFSVNVTKIAAVKLNGDVFQDIVVGGPGGGTFALASITGNGQFNSTGPFTAPGSNVVDFAIGDIDNDGDQDIFVALTGSTNFVSALLSNGSGNYSFRSLVSPTPTGIAVGDFSGDNVADFVVSFSNSAPIIYRYVSGNLIADANTLGPASGNLPSGSAILTLTSNNDGVPDLAVFNANTLSVYASNGLGIYALNPGGADTVTGTSVYATDLNFDGYTDVVATNPAAGTIDFYLANMPPTLTAETTTRQAGSPGFNSQVATAGDIETPIEQLTLTVDGGNTATVNGVTVTLTDSNGAAAGTNPNGTGQVFADVIAACGATTATFTLTVTDSGGLPTTTTLTVTVMENTPPIFSYNNASISRGASTTINPSTTPSDNGSIASFNVFSTGTYTGAISVSPVGVVSVSNANPIGMHTITIRATDNCGAVTDSSFTFTVTNNLPNISIPVPPTRQQGSPGTFATIANVTDPDQPAGSLTVTPTSVPAGISITNIVNVNGQVNATVAADCNAAVGDNPVVLTVTDSNGGSRTGNYSVNVTANTAPTLAYANASLTLGTAATMNPSTGPADNGSVANIVLRSQGGYAGGISVNNTTGVITLAGATPAGTYTIVVRATDNCGATTDASFQLTVGKANTGLVITSDNPDPSTVGQSVVVNYSLNPATGVVAPTGSVVVTVSGGPETCTGTIDPATATGACTIVLTSPGSRPLTATYAGDANFNGSVSATAPHTVNPVSTATGVQVSINAPNYGSTLTATATMVAVAPGSGTPQGTVSFNDGGTPITGCQNVPVSPLGAAVCTTNQLPAGVNKVIQAVYSGNANFNGSNGSATQTIGKAPLNVQASSATVTYGDAAPGITSTITGFVLGETAANLTTQPSCSTTYTQGSAVSGSQYPASCSGAVSNNYSFNYLGGNVTVNKKALTVAADNKSRTYGTANPALTATISGFVLGQNLATSGVTGTAGLSTTATATSPAGTYPITVTLGTLQSGNYSFGTFTNGTLTVTAAQLTITADNQTRVYGAPNPALTFQITGFVNGEGVGVLTGTPSVTTTATATSAPGTYPITVAQGTLASANYTFATANGTLTVTTGSTTTTITNAAALGTATSVGQSYPVNWTTTPVAPATGTPTGNVTVTDGSQTCTAAVAVGTCSLTSTTSGTKTITATYAGDANFTGSTSQSVQHNVVIGLTGNVKQFVAFGTNTNLAGVTITLTNTTTQQSTTTTTDASGNYSFVNVTLGQNFTITPSGLGKVYEATSRTYNNAGGNISGADFLAYDVVGPNSIPRSARVQSQIATQGQPVTVPILFTATGVETKVSFSVEYPTNALGIPTVTCGSGTVNCTVTIDNSLSGKAGITVTPTTALTAGTREIVKITFPTFQSPATSAQIRFGDFPTAKDVRNAENNALPTLYWTDGLVSFTGGTLLDGATISGRVTTAAGQGLRNATVTLLDTAGGRRTTVTSSFGNYQFENLDTGRDYMLIVTSKRYRFATRMVNLTENLSDVNLIGLE
ncbi:MAG: MBG domain-containing protein [Pyrinomonadaceae bacterium]